MMAVQSFPVVAAVAVVPTTVVVVELVHQLAGHHEPPAGRPPGLTVLKLTFAKFS